MHYLYSWDFKYLIIHFLNYSTLSNNSFILYILRIFAFFLAIYSYVLYTLLYIIIKILCHLRHYLMIQLIKSKT